jgi:hypothetical protein
MATFSKKMGGKEVGQAGVYAKPHTMSGAATKATLPTKTGAAVMDKTNISVAGISKGNYPPENRHGEQTMRGYGAATKGIKTRGPMA